MDDGRYYPTVTTLGGGEGYGKILAMSGLRAEISGCSQVVNRDPEIYHPNTGWIKMASPPQAIQPFNDLYTGAHVIPYGGYAGKIFYSMPMRQAWIFNPFFSGLPNGGYWTAIGQNRIIHRDHGNSVLLPLLPGSTSAKVMIIGGGPPATNTADIIDLASSSPEWSSVNPMTYARENANAVILPDDKILVTGGNLFHPTEGAIFTAELYNIETETWKQLPPLLRRRMYHSTAILLPNGRVWVGGTEIGLVKERNIEIYSPGYLSEGSRPEFIQPPPNIINYGTQFNFSTDLPIGSIRLIKFSATTHATDMDQRSVGLSFSEGPVNGGINWTATAPAKQTLLHQVYICCLFSDQNQQAVQGRQGFHR
jgi:galactose oxidase